MIFWVCYGRMSSHTGGTTMQPTICQLLMVVGLIEFITQRSVVVDFWHVELTSDVVNDSSRMCRCGPPT